MRPAPVSREDVYAFLESAFRNIDLPILGDDDVHEIADGLARFVAARTATLRASAR